MSAELKVLPLNGHAVDNKTVAAHLREQAQWIEEGHYKDVKHVFLLIINKDGNYYRQTCGLPVSTIEAIGHFAVSLNDRIKDTNG